MVLQFKVQSLDFICKTQKIFLACLCVYLSQIQTARTELPTTSVPRSLLPTA